MATTYEHSRLLICEGHSDVKFFDKLISSRGLPHFQTDFPKIKTNSDSGGWSKIGRHLKAIQLQEDFIQNVKLIVLVGDNDEAASFGQMCSQASEGGFGVPTNPQEIVHAAGKPDLSIIMIPPSTFGCLETLCCKAGIAKWPTLEGPLDAYMANSPANNWSISKKSKMQVQCLLAATCEARPDVPLSYHWEQDKKYHIPVGDPAFDEIADILSELGNVGQ